MSTSSRDSGTAGTYRIWSKFPQRTERLLEWLDKNEEGRTVIFSIPNWTPSTSLSSKLKWCEEAAKAVFSVDEVESVRREGMDDPERFASSIRNQVEHSWAQKYKKFNDAVGTDIANMAVENIIPGTPAYVAVEKQLRCFPIWKRLHAHWRTNKRYNLLYEKQAEVIATPTPLSQKVQNPSRQFIDQVDKNGKEYTVEIVRYKTPGGGVHVSISPAIYSVHKDHAEKILLSKEEYIEHDKPSKPEIKLPTRGAEVLISSKPVQDKKRRVEDDEDTNASGSSKKVHHSSPTDKLENEALEKIAAAEERKAAADLRRLEIETQAEERCRQEEANNQIQRAREKHDFLMRVMGTAGMTMGGAVVLGPEM
ncbi:hypothetical protein D9613_010994 [Agrocybe pediades]|uniref:Uncharacterized protein n=1 Tax=Agrocybe pediades TaxID=84607 RepID=A0A8H4VJ62_9AGAR|nr:hypothetical protein D9613_010994 [Agrocybe pediades]